MRQANSLNFANVRSTSPLRTVLILTLSGFHELSRAVFDADALERLQAIFQKVCRDFQVQLVEMNGEAEHVHLLINYQPKHSVSGMVNSLKGVSSRLLRSERPDLEKHYWRNVLWSPSYFAASCGGAPLDIIKQYVRQEKNPL